MSDLSSLIADQWQPIDSAPTDGTVVDLWNSTVQERVPNAKFDAGKWKVWWLDGLDRMAWVTAEYQPGLTHWMPLPSPPRALQQKGSSNG